jgi:hypothetical protein
MQAKAVSIQLYRRLDAEGHFSQENGPLQHFKMPTVASKPL